ncbi:3'-5' exonuclease [Kitasatospora kifunensis]|uniref:DNA polymerase III epsilon subunit-like protein n=1 Tax=Kitasatospora kifunensis TaxID=58351 RepID=A0A7W7VT25_KITKI|nr:3'-5' exonuclease [Kitasatospora kifunensis]MBB4921343.1 DNA polymerase III epsilon subunit-like protein [Kitasatospora kifunensis]
MDFGTWPRLLVVDVEGNGATPPDLVELAAIPIEHGRPVPESTRSTLVRPPHPITAFATRIHHITNQNVANAPAWEQIAQAVQTDLAGCWIAAHNASVDYNVLKRHLPAWEPTGVIDTLRLARATYTDASRFGLDVLLTHAGIDLTDVPGQRHRAGFDAHATALLLLDLASHYSTWETLLTAAVPPNMPGAPTRAPKEETLW